MSQEPSEGHAAGGRRALVEVLLAYAFASAMAAGLYRAQGLPLVRDNLHALVAAVFLFLPQAVLRGRADIDAYGFRLRPLGLGLAVAAGFIVGVLPLFALGFLLVSRFACTHVPLWVPGNCWHVQHPAWHLPPGFATLAFAQLIVVALPEELFFRGYLQGRLEDVFPPTRTLFGARVGWALLLQAALFGLGHFLVTFDPAMLTRAIPGLLFGWMFARTRSIVASTLFHAVCNLTMEVLVTSLL